MTELGAPDGGRRSVRGLLIDIDGVLVVSWQPIEGAADALSTCRAAGVPVRFLTNTTSASRVTFAHRLRAGGIAVDVDEIWSAPAATAAWLRAEHPGARCYLVNTGDLGDDLADVRLVGSDEPADVVVLGGAGEEFSYTQMNHALRLLLEGAVLVGMHRNMYWKTTEGFNLDTGAYLTALEQASGVRATVVGKPSADFFRTALGTLPAEADCVAMVGDDIENDVLAAQVLGLAGILVRTGKYRPETVERAHGTPDVVIDSIADLPAILDLG